MNPVRPLRFLLTYAANRTKKPRENADVKSQCRSNRVNLLFVLVMSVALPYAAAGGGDPKSIFQQANTAYRASDYQQAAFLYEKLIGVGVKDADVHYNLGNAYFKEKKIGPAILEYERAKKKDPRNRDVYANLNYTRGLLEYRVDDKRNWYLKALESALGYFTGKEIGILALFCGVLFWVSWGLALHFHPDAPRDGKQKTLLVLTLLFLSFWILKGSYARTGQEAIVLKPQASVRYGPSYKDQVAVKLGEGMKVHVGKKAGDWSRIILSNGETGWIANEEIGII